MPVPSSTTDWPHDTLLLFCAHMQRVGQPVNLPRMAGSTTYALQQLAAAHAVGDAALTDLSLRMFRHFERSRAGLLQAA